MTASPANDRRNFLKAASLSAVAVAGWRRRARGNDANDTVVVGLIGCGSRGASPGYGLAADFLRAPNVKLAYLCDPVRDRREKAAKQFDLDASRAVADFRKILDDRSVDAVAIAAPDHWHCPAAILACEAGKHVYVEKPLSHNLREGRLLVEAADRSKRMVQHGTQARSTGFFIEAFRRLREGLIGDVLSAKCWNIQRRASLGHAEPSEPPSDFDYELLVGPAPMIPYKSNLTQVQGQWGRRFHFGNGDIANDGVHELDQCRWALNLDTHPTRIFGLGRNLYFDDDAETPDTQQVVFEYPAGGVAGRPQMITYEQRMWSTNYPHNVDSGVEFYGTEGQLLVSRRGKVQLLDANNRRVETDLAPESMNAPAHVANFIEAVRNGVKLVADALTGHLSTSLVHLGNISTRLGRPLTFDPAAETFVDDQQANSMLRREYRDHWAKPSA